MLNSITLSTGKTIKIPIFDAWTGKGTKTRANGVLRDYDSSNHIVYSSVTDAELLELGNILCGSNKSNLTIKFDNQPTSRNGHWCMILFWDYYPTGNTYELRHPFNVSNDGTSIEAHSGGFGDSSNNARFYRSYNSAPAHGTTDFFELCAWYNSQPSENPSTPISNIRPGAYYTLDLYWYNSPYTAGGSMMPGDAVNESALYTKISTYEQLTHTEVIYTEPGDTFEDPYGNIISEPGGGDGDIGVDPENIEKATIPALPTLSAVDAGMITMYYATNGQLNALAAYLWSNIYDLEANFVKLFSSPMDCIIGLGIVPVIPTLGSASAVKFGNINSPIYMTKLASQFVEKDCGWIQLPKWIGCFLDFAPYVKLSLYLPYIGYRDLNPNDVMGHSIHVVYHIDCLTGGCCAMIETEQTLLYSFNGSCIANVPLTATNFSSAIQNAISAVSSVGKGIGNLATGNIGGTIGNLTDAANAALNMGPDIQRSGAMGGAAGLMSYQKPMLVIERPRMCVPLNLNHFKGNTLYVTRQLSACQGFTQIDMINLDGVPCTSTERKELETILHEGVYF